MPLPERPARPRRSDGRLVLGTQVRISPQKKLDELLAALRHAHDRLPAYVLRIAGSVERGGEDHADALREMARGLCVEWVGWRESEEFLAELDVFVMVAEPGGCPNASLETLALGLAVVATDVGGMAEQVRDGETGRLVPRGNARPGRGGPRAGARPGAAGNPGRPRGRARRGPLLLEAHAR